MLFPIFIETSRSPSEGDTFRVLVPSLPGCSAVGVSVEDAIANAREAIGRRLRSLRAADVPVPPLLSARQLLKEHASVPGRTLHFIGIPTFRREHGSDTWHFCGNCSHWPALAYVEEYDPPIAAEVCNECRAKEADRICRF